MSIFITYQKHGNYVTINFISSLPFKGLNSNPTGLTVKGEITPVCNALFSVSKRTERSLNPSDPKSKVTIKDPGLEKQKKTCLISYEY